MRMTAGEFIGLVRRQGIKCDVHRGQLRLTGNGGDMLNKLRAVLKNNPELAHGVKEQIEGESLMTAGEFVRECANAGIVLQIDTWTYDIDMAGGNEKTRARLRSILAREPWLKAGVILREAMRDSALMDSIQERACIRWSNGYSDSLLSAVQCKFMATGEEIERDSDGQIILKPRTDWRAEISRQ